MNNKAHVEKLILDIPSLFRYDVVVVQFTKKKMRKMQWTSTSSTAFKRFKPLMEFVLELKMKNLLSLSILSFTLHLPSRSPDIMAVRIQRKNKIIRRIELHYSFYSSLFCSIFSEHMQSSSGDKYFFK